MPDYAIRRLVQIEPYLTEAWFSEMNVRLTHTILRLRPEMATNIKLTDGERDLLVQLIRAVEASEWSAGDYNFTQAQFNSLQRAKAKLELRVPVSAD